MELKFSKNFSSPEAAADWNAVTARSAASTISPARGFHLMAAPVPA